MKYLFSLMFLLLISLSSAQAQDAEWFGLVDVIGRGTIERVYWAEQGRTLAVTTQSGVWLYPADDLTQTPRHIPFDAVRTVAFDLDGTTMAVAEEGGIGLYDVGTGQRFDFAKAGYSVYHVLTFSADGKYVAAAVDPDSVPARNLMDQNGESFIHVWSLDQMTDMEGRPVRIYIHPDQMPPRAFAFSPDNTQLAVVASYIAYDYALQEFFLLDLASGEVQTFSNSAGQLSSPQPLDHVRVVTSTSDRYFFAAFDPHPAQFGLEILKPRVPRQVYAVSSDAQWAAVEGRDALEIQTTGNEKVAVTLLLDHIEEVVFSPDSTQMAVVSDGRLGVYNMAALADAPDPCGRAGASACVTYTDAHLSMPLTTEQVAYNGSAISPSGQWELALRQDWDYTLRRLDADFRITLVTNTDPNVLSVHFSPNESFVAAAFTSYSMGGEDDTVARVWDLRDDAPTPEPLAVLPHTAEMGPLLFSPDESLLVTTSANGDVFVWETNTWKKLASLPHPAAVLQLRFSDDGRELITLASDGLTRVWRRFDGD